MGGFRAGEKLWAKEGGANWAMSVEAAAVGDGAWRSSAYNWGFEV